MFFPFDYTQAIRHLLLLFTAVGKLSPLSFDSSSRKPQQNQRVERNGVFNIKGRTPKRKKKDKRKEN